LGGVSRCAGAGFHHAGLRRAARRPHRLWPGAGPRRCRRRRAGGPVLPALPAHRLRQPAGGCAGPRRRPAAAAGAAAAGGIRAWRSRLIAVYCRMRAEGRPRRQSGGLLPIDILIAEDEPSILESLDFILRRAGWSVESVTDGQAALEGVRRLKPRILVLDVMLPRRSGFDVL